MSADFKPLELKVLTGGYDIDECRAALNLCEGDFDKALSLLLKKSKDNDYEAYDGEVYTGNYEKDIQKAFKRTSEEEYLKLWDKAIIEQSIKDVAQKLRNLTGESIHDCIKALKFSDYDFDKAVIYLDNLKNSGLRI